MLCKLIRHTHLSPLSLLDSAGRTLSFQVLRFSCGDWGDPGTHPWNFSLLSPCAPRLSPLLSAENFLSSLSAAAAKPAGRPSCLQHVLSLGRALISDTHRCSVPFPVPSVTLWTWSRPDPGLVERPTAPRFLLQRSKPTEMGNIQTKSKEGPNPQCEPYFSRLPPPPLLSLFIWPLTQGNGILSCDLLLRYKHTRVCARTYGVFPQS